jgi:hypothetical protein
VNRRNASRSQNVRCAGRDHKTSVAPGVASGMRRLKLRQFPAPT